MSAGVGVVPVASPEGGRRSAMWRRIRNWLTVLFVLGLVGGASAGIYRYRQSLNVTTYPVAPARQGDFLVIIRCRGELKAQRSIEIYAPRVPDLRIAWHVRRVLWRFDSVEADRRRSARLRARIGVRRSVVACEHGPA